MSCFIVLNLNRIAKFPCFTQFRTITCTLEIWCRIALSVNSTSLFFQHAASAFRLDKPMVIGEFNQEHGGGKSSADLFDWAYTKGYAGAWTWSRTDVSWSSQLQGMQHLKGRSDHGAVNFHL